MSDVAKAVVGTPMEARIDSMFARDRATAGLLVVALWITVLFVLFAMRNYMSHSVEVVCWIAAAILLLFNTASIVAMTRHYANDKEHIYGVDIQHLDAGR
jgi:uncharacterized integral membrane protein